MSGGRCVRVSEGGGVRTTLVAHTCIHIMCEHM